jgi:hypothetical protein
MPTKPTMPIPANVKLDGSGTAAEKVPDPCAVKLPIVASEPVPTMPSAGLTLENVNDAPRGVFKGRDGEKLEVKVTVAGGSEAVKVATVPPLNPKVNPEKLPER